MGAEMTFVKETGEPDVRLRVNFMGQLVVQVRYSRVSPLLSVSPRTSWGWRDARANDPREVAAVFGILNVSGLSA